LRFLKKQNCSKPDGGYFGRAGFNGKPIRERAVQPARK
jgi:hypothetical protein